jgi:hypothetical protein
MPDNIGADGHHHREFLPTLFDAIRSEMGAIIGNLPDIIRFCQTS